MAVQHKNITEADLHATKGASTATANTVKYADGAGGEGWSKVTKAMVDTTTLPSINTKVLNTTFPDIGTPSSTFAVAPTAGKITSCIIVAPVNIMGTNAVSIRIGGVAAGTINTSNLVAGTTASVTLNSNNTVTAGQVIELVSDGNTSSTSMAFVTLVLDN